MKKVNLEKLYKEPRFDMARKPIKCKWYLKIVEDVGSMFFMLFNNGHVHTDKEVKKIKGPFIILSTHASMMDFPEIVWGLWPRRNGWVMSVEEFRRTDWLTYGFGGVPKRKFTHGALAPRLIFYYLKNLKQAIAIYPEARFEFAGINEQIDETIGRFCKKAGVPVVMCMTNGNFVNSPQWCKHPYRKIRHEAHIYRLLSVDDLNNMSAEEIQDKIEKAFVKDEYKWQVENNLHIKCKKRAEGLHRLLYKCPVCGCEFEMEGKGTTLTCKHCGATWEMDTLSRLHGVNTDKGFSHIPDWYKWEREQVKQEVFNGTYRYEDDVRIEDYYNSRVNCVEVGNGHLVQDENGFTLTGTVNGKPFELNKPLSSMYSVHVEFNFLGRGDSIDLATDETSYFVYPQIQDKITKVHLAQEELYNYHVKNKQ